MLDKLTHTDFEPCLHSVFSVRIAPDTAVPLTLTDVQLMAERLGSGAGVMRDRSFALLFRGPLEPLLPQSMYTFEHDTIGTIESMFIVPIGRDDLGTTYEAVFN